MVGTKWLWYEMTVIPSQSDLFCNFEHHEGSKCHFNNNTVFSHFRIDDWDDDTFGFFK